MKDAIRPGPHCVLACTTGGMAACPGFQNRLYSDLRRLVPQEHALTLRLPGDPVTAAFRGGARVAASPLYRHVAWTKAAYEEQGSARLHGYEDADRT